MPLDLADAWVFVGLVYGFVFGGRHLPGVDPVLSSFGHGVHDALVVAPHRSPWAAPLDGVSHCNGFRHRRRLRVSLGDRTVAERHYFPCSTYPASRVSGSASVDVALVEGRAVSVYVGIGCLLVMPFLDACGRFNQSVMPSAFREGLHRLHAPLGGDGGELRDGRVLAAFKFHYRQPVIY